MKYVINETTGRDGYPQAQKMWLDVFPNPTELKKKYQWFYESESFLSSLYLLRESGVKEVVGAFGVASRAYNLNNTEQGVGLCADFAVHKSHQTLVPALQLVKGLVNGSSDKCDLLLGFPNNKAVKVMCRAGFRVLGEIPRYALILKSKYYINKTVLSSFSSLLAVPIDFFLKLYFRVSRCKQFSDFELTEIFSVDESFDNLWGAYIEQNHLHTGKRDRAYLNWRFFLHPCEVYRVFAFKNKKSQLLEGYIVVQVDAERHWNIFDFFTVSGAYSQKCLIQKMITIAIKENAISLSLEFLGSLKITQLLHALKFSKRTTERRVVLGPLMQPNEFHDDLFDVNNWYITSADELG